jgi:hypothetical protein
MNLNQAYPSKYLTAEDLNDQSATVTISDVVQERLGQGKDASDKLVISFQGKKKSLVCNKTNAKTIAKVLGSDETDDWIGQRIIIEPREVEFQGDMVLALRVSLKKPAAPAAAPAAHGMMGKPAQRAEAAPQQAVEDGEESEASDIPF